METGVQGINGRNGVETWVHHSGFGYGLYLGIEHRLTCVWLQYGSNIDKSQSYNKISWNGNDSNEKTLSKYHWLQGLRQTRPQKGSSGCWPKCQQLQLCDTWLFYSMSLVPQWSCLKKSGLTGIISWFNDMTTEKHWCFIKCLDAEIKFFPLSCCNWIFSILMRII